MFIVGESVEFGVDNNRCFRHAVRGDGMPPSVSHCLGFYPAVKLESLPEA